MSGPVNCKRSKKQTTSASIILYLIRGQNKQTGDTYVVHSDSRALPSRRSSWMALSSGFRRSECKYPQVGKPPQALWQEGDQDEGKNNRRT